MDNGTPPKEEQAVETVAENQAHRSTDLVRVEDVTKTFGSKTAVKGVSFSVPAGQICGLLGPNGAGKTTLFRLLMGILKATQGRILIDGLDAFEDRARCWS
jgi:ABC-type multidrug transport system ATPase subunit